MHDNRLFFGVAPPAPRQSMAESPPVHKPVQAGPLEATGSLVIGSWDGLQAQWLTALPGEAARGGQYIYDCTGLSWGPHGLLIGGGYNRPNLPIGRYWSASLDPDTGKVREMRIDPTPGAIALASNGDTWYVARNGDPGPPPSPPLLEAAGGRSWQLAIGNEPLVPPRFTWTPGGIAASSGQIWAEAQFSGEIRVAGTRLESPGLDELPVAGSLPRPMLEQLKTLLQQHPMPPLPALVLLFLDRQGDLIQAPQLRPARILVGDAAGGGLDPAKVHGGPLAVAPDGAALAGRYQYAVTNGEETLLAPEGEGGARCFVARWNGDGTPAWLADPGSESLPLGIFFHRRNLLVVTEQELLILDGTTGSTRSRLPLPRGEIIRGPGIRWTHAAFTDGNLGLGGILQGKVKLHGRLLETQEPMVVLLRERVDE